MRLHLDFTTSVRKALNEIDPAWESYAGLIVCGSHGMTRDQMELILKELKAARENAIPALGICQGMQLQAIEASRNLLGIKGATSAEIDPNSPNAVIVPVGELVVGIRYVSWWGGKGHESHWHNYMVSPDLALKNFDLWIDGGIIEAMRYPNHPFYGGVQFHPEYQSSKERPHPLLKEFLDVCRKLSC